MSAPLTSAPVTAAAGLDRRQPPEPRPLRPFAFPAFERRRLSNGLEVLLLASSRTPLIYLERVFPAGAEREPTALAGLATLTASLLTEGTETRSAPEIADTLERLGGSYGSSASWDAASLSLRLPARHLATGLSLLAEIASRPAFPPGDVERVRQQRLTELLRRRDQPATQADLALVRAIYGQHPYCRSVLGDPETVGALDRETMLRFFQHAYPADGGALIAVGDFAPAAMLDALEAAFGSAAGAPVAAVELPPPPPAVRQVWILDRPGAPQTELRVGQVGLDRRHPDLVAAKVANSLFGGKFTSRLNLNLRERNGYTYGASSYFSARRGPGPFVVSAAVGTPNAAAAAAEIFFELDRLLAAPPASGEVADTVQYLLGTFPFTLQTLGGLGSRLEEIATFGLPSDTFDRERREVAEVTAERVHAVASQHLAPETMSLVAVGPAERLASELAAFGPVEVLTS